MRYVFKTEVTSVNHHDRVVSGRKTSEGDAVLTKENLGWFVHLKGSHEALYVGDTKPELKAGDVVKVTIEKV